ncbi:putative RNA polymerase sigma factor FecI [Myxococcaceae bacterium]|nr:putative RNA polymerase sigma factor FecI [Myxococcaceae bacterium]
MNRTIDTTPAFIESAFLDTRKPLLQYLKRRLGCSHTAEDVAQETYLRVVQHESIGEVADLRAYMFRIARNLVVDHGRQAVTRAQSSWEPLDEDLVCPKPAPDRVAEASEQLQMLERMIAELPPRCRRVFLLHRVQHLSHSEIAEHMGISPRTVESQIGKALKILRDRMGA